MANKFGAQLRNTMAKSEERVEDALNGKPEPMVQPQAEPGTQEFRKLETQEDDSTNGKTEKAETPSTLNPQSSTLPSTEVLTGKDAFRQEYSQFYAESDFTNSKSMNFSMPAAVRQKFLAIKEELNNTNKTMTKISAQDIVNILVWEGVEKWYSSITGKKE